MELKRWVVEKLAHEVEFKFYNTHGQRIDHFPDKVYNFEVKCDGVYETDVRKVEFGNLDYSKNEPMKVIIHCERFMWKGDPDYNHVKAGQYKGEISYPGKKFHIKCREYYSIDGTIHIISYDDARAQAENECVEFQKI